MSDLLDNFIKAIRPNGGHLHVAAIGEDHPPHGRVFPLATHMDELRDFITLNNAAGANIYYTLNEVEGRDEPYELAKPSKAQITGIVGFHVDVDPDLKAAGGDYIKARERLRNGLCDAIKDTHPTVLVDSGNGLQALYIADTKPECLDAAEAKNYGLIEHFGGDPGTHNIDRLLRMPFTINHADKRKQSKGYPAQSKATVLAYNDPGQAKLPPPVTPPPSDRRDDTHPTIKPLTDAQRGVAEARWDEAMQWHSKLAQRWRGDTEGLKDKSRSAIDKSIGSIMNIQGFSLDEFAYLVNEYPPANSAFAEQDERYLRRCWERDEELADLPVAVEIDLEASVPPRPIIYKSYVRGFLTGTAGAGGSGKTALVDTEVMSLALGVDLEREPVPLYGRTPIKAGPQRVLTLSLEDDRDEYRRRHKAIAEHYGLTPDDLKLLRENRKVVFDRQGTLRIAELKDNSAEASETVREHIKTQIIQHNADVLIIDPLVSFHSIDENNTGHMQTLKSILVGLADELQISVHYVHHTRKGGENVADAMRGSGTLKDGSRNVRMVQRLTRDAAIKVGADESVADNLMQTNDGKNNLGPTGGGNYYQFDTIDLDNASDQYHTDIVGVVSVWTKPDLFDGIPVELCEKAWKAIDAADEQERRESPQSPQWVGYLIAPILDIPVKSPGKKSPGKPTDKKCPGAQKIKRILTEWQRVGVLERYKALNENRKKVPIVRVNWAAATPTEDGWHD